VLLVTTEVVAISSFEPFFFFETDNQTVKKKRQSSRLVPRTPLPQFLVRQPVLS
jgi:hypothetical protein